MKQKETFRNQVVFPIRQNPNFIQQLCFQGIGNKVTANILAKVGFNTLVLSTGSKPIINQTAKNYMFGYEDALITLAYNTLPSWIFFKKLGIIDRVDTRKNFQRITLEVRV